MALHNEIGTSPIANGLINYLYRVLRVAYHLFNVYKKNIESANNFSVIFSSSYRERGSEVAQPGVGSPNGYDEEEVEERWRFHNYYQWVVFFLFFQVSCHVCV